MQAGINVDAIKAGTNSIKTYVTMVIGLSMKLDSISSNVFPSRFLAPIK